MTQIVSHKNGMEMNDIDIEYYFLKTYILAVCPLLESRNEGLYFVKVNYFTSVLKQETH